MKKTKVFRLLLAVLVTMMLLSLNAAAQVVKDGLYIYYPFEGNANNALGQYFHGVIEGATFTKGIIGNCCHFGGCDNPQIIRISHRDVYNSFQKPELYTFAFWIKLDSNGMDANKKKVNNGKMTIFYSKGMNHHNPTYTSKRNAGEYTSFDINVIDDNSFKLIFTNHLKTYKDQFETKQTEIVVNKNAYTWHHIVVSSKRIYIDGKFVKNYDVNIKGFGINEGEFIIGAGESKNSYPFHGCIDDFRIYGHGSGAERQLDDYEVALLYREGGLVYQQLNAFEYHDLKLIDNDIDYKLFEDKCSSEDYVICENTKKLYSIQQSKIVEYDCRNLLDRKVSKRTINTTFPFLPKTQSTRYRMDVSPDGQLLAVMGQNNMLYVINSNDGNTVATYQLTKLINEVNMENLCNEWKIKKYSNPFRFVSNNEIIIAGSNAAVVFNIQTKKGKKVSYGYELSNLPKFSVSGSGIITGFYAGKRGKCFNDSLCSFVINNGKITDIQKGKGRSDDQSNRNVTVRVGGGKYFFMFNGERFRDELTTNDKKFWMFFPDRKEWSWMFDYKVYFIRYDDRITFFDMSLTDREMDKQHVNKILKQNSLDTCNKYLKENPTSPYIELVKNKRVEIVEQLWQQTSDRHDYSVAHLHKLEKFISDYSDITSMENAQKEIQNLYQMAFNKISYGDIEQLKSYITNYPNSPYVNEARKKINNVLQLQEEERLAAEQRAREEEERQAAIKREEEERQAAIKREHERKITVNCNYKLWSKGDHICYVFPNGSYKDKIACGTLEEWNENRTKAHIKIVTSPSNSLTYDGELLEKNNTFWISTQGTKWHLAIEGEFEKSLEYDDSKKSPDVIYVNNQSSSDVRRYNDCSYCHGSGRLKCLSCHGSGWDSWDDKTCTSCRGQGTEQCYHCGGTGKE